jgi:hypothetical protein
MLNEMKSIRSGKPIYGGKILAIGFVCLISASAFSQNITNTLPPSGKFIVKDASSNYLTLDQSTGQVNILQTLRLENTTSSSLGIIFKGDDRFIHNYGTNNTFMGINSGNFAMTGGYNTAIGDQSLVSNTTGDYNAALGYNSLSSNTTGERNTALGIASLYSNTTGFYNTAVGNGSLSSNIVGTQNTALGNQSLGANTYGSKNTAFGYQSLYSNTTGSFNTSLGYSAGSSIITGNNITCVGFSAQPTSGTAINQITLGDNFITSLRCNVQTITSLSDARDKTNVKDLDLGIDFLMKIKPRLFNWDKREWYENNKSDGSKIKEEPTAGFIAQELDETQTIGNAEWLNLVLKDNPEKWEATPGNLLPIMVKAIQDLKKENDELKNNNDKLSVEVESLKSISEKLVTLEQLVNELSSVKRTILVTKN